MEAEVAVLDRLAEVAPPERARAFAAARAASLDPRREIRAAAARALGATGEPDEALPQLARLAADEDVGVRHEAAAVLAGLPWRGRLDPLAARLADPDPGVVSVAADGLAHSGDSRATEALHRLSGQPRLRFVALEGLLALRDERLSTEIAPRLFRSYFVPPFEKALAAVALARGGDETARRYLRERLARRRAEERPFILVHLARADPEEGRRLVEAVANDEQDYLRESAVLALVRLDSSWWAAAQAAVGRHAGDDPHVAAEVLLALAEVDSERAALLAAPACAREDEHGAAARRVRLAAALRRAHPREVLPRCD